MSEPLSFGAWLKRRRKSLDLTQQALAERVACSVVSISKFEQETQRPSRSLAARLAEQLQIPADQQQAFIRFARFDGSVGWLTFNQPERRNAVSLEALVSELLDLSRLDANAAVFRSEEVDLDDLLHSLRRDFGFTGRELNIKVEDGVPPVETDSKQLERTLTILVDNAIKYSGEGSPVDLALSRENGHAVVSVSDRGCGIPEGEIPHIFERFYRAEGSSRADGTGLGLALAKEITDHLGGQIRVKSKPNVGSTFSLLLPLGHKPSPN